MTTTTQVASLRIPSPQLQYLLPMNISQSQMPRPRLLMPYMSSHPKEIRLIPHYHAFRIHIPPRQIWPRSLTHCMSFHPKENGKSLFCQEPISPFRAFPALLSFERFRLMYHTVPSRIRRTPRHAGHFSCPPLFATDECRMLIPNSMLANELLSQFEIHHL